VYELKNGDGQLTAEVRTSTRDGGLLEVAGVAFILTCVHLRVFVHAHRDSRRKLMESSAARLAPPLSRSATSRQETTRECSISGAYSDERSLLFRHLRK